MDLKPTFSRFIGRHVLGPGVFFTTLVYGLLAHFLGSSDLGSGNYLIRILAVAAAHIAMMAIAYGAFFLVRRWRLNQTTVGVFILGIGIAGAVRGLILQYLLFEFDVAEEIFSPYRLYGGVVAMSTGLLWAIYAFGIKADWGTKQANLKAAQKQLEELLTEAEQKLDTEASDTMSTIESMLQTALIPELMVTPQHAVVKLQSLINDTLRPLSSFLATSQPRIEVKKLDPSVFRFKWTSLIRHLRLRDASSALPLALILSTVAVNAFTKYLPEGDVLPAMAISFFSLLVLLSFNRYVLARFVDALPAKGRFPLSLAVMFVTGLIGGLVVVLQHPGNRAMVDLAFNAAIWVTLLGMLFAMNQSATVEISNIEKQLHDNEHRLRWTIAALNAQHWLQKKQFARKLHGPVQSEVAAAAIRIERSLTSGEMTEYGETALQNLRDRLAKILHDTKGTSAVRPVLAEITETWDGLCQIEVDLPTEVEAALTQDSVCVETVLEITREACSNAIRHGSAEHIELSFGFQGCDLIEVTVANDGSSGETSTRRGIGSAYLDDCTYSHDLRMTKDGAVLTATVPLHRK